MNQDDTNQEKDKKKSIKRSKSFDVRGLFRSKSKNETEESTAERRTLNEFQSPPLNRNHSQPESTKLNTLKKSFLERTQSMKKTTADFFGVNKEHETENYQLWLEKRKRFYAKSGGKIKEIKDKTEISSDTNDSQHVNLFATGGLDLTSVNYGLYSAFTLPKPSVLRLAKKGIKNLQQEKAKKTNLIGDEQSPAICMGVFKSNEPQEFSLKQPQFDDTAEDQIESFHLFDKETIDASEFLPDDLIFNVQIPRKQTKTWTIVERQGRPRINSKLIESIYDNSDRRQYGMGIIGKLLNRRFKSNLTKEEKEQLDSIDDSRPYFTYWIMSVQFIIMILALLTYGFGPVGLQKVKISKPVLVNSLSIQEVSYFEPNNIWLGPRPVS